MNLNSFTPRFFVVSSSKVDAELHNEKTNMGYVKTGLKATDKTVDILRFITREARTSSRRSALSCLNDYLDEDGSFKMTENGEIVLDLTVMSVDKMTANSFMGETRQTVLNILAAGIARYILGNGDEFRKKEDDPDFAVEKPLYGRFNSPVMKTEEFQLFTLFGWEKDMEQWNNDSRCKVMISAKDVKCIYDILVGRDGKKLSSKYGEVYNEFAVR